MKNILKKMSLVVAVLITFSAQVIAASPSTFEIIEYPGADNT
jgi:hypothetical protein